MNFCMKPSAPTHWWKDTCLGCGAESIDHYRCHIGDEKILCPACAEKDNNVQKDIVRCSVTRILKDQYPTWGESCVAVEVCGKPKTKFHLGVYERPGEAGPQESSPPKECNKYQIQTYVEEFDEVKEEYYSIQCTKHSSATFTMVSEGKMLIKAHVQQMNKVFRIGLADEGNPNHMAFSPPFLVQSRDASEPKVYARPILWDPDKLEASTCSKRRNDCIQASQRKGKSQREGGFRTKKKTKKTTTLMADAMMKLKTMKKEERKVVMMRMKIARIVMLPIVMPIVMKILKTMKGKNVVMTKKKIVMRKIKAMCST